MASEEKMVADWENCGAGENGGRGENGGEEERQLFAQKLIYEFVGCS
jgi:hypothetical protein